MNRPRIILNCAISADGKLALPDRTQLRISSDEDMKRVFELRNSCDAVLVGSGAVLADDPKLTVKEKYVKHPRNPIRVVLDTHLKTPVNALVVNTDAPTILFVGNDIKKNNHYTHSVEIIQCQIDKDGLIDLDAMLEILYKKGVQSILVEGGGTVLWNFLSKKLFDELYVYIGPMIIGGSGTPTLADGNGVSTDNEIIRLRIASTKRLGEGLLITYKLRL